MSIIKKWLAKKLHKELLEFMAPEPDYDVIVLKEHSRFRKYEIIDEKYVIEYHTLKLKDAISKTVDECINVFVEPPQPDNPFRIIEAELKILIPKRA